MDQTSQKPPGGKGRKSPADRWVKRGFLLAILLAVAIVLYIQYRGPMLGWPGDLDEVLTKAKAENRHIVVFVRTFPVSTTGKRMVQTTLAQKKNIESLKKGGFLLAEVRLDSSAAWAKKYGVTKTPTMLLIAPDGEKFHKAEGMIGEIDFRKNFLHALSQKSVSNSTASGPASRP